MDKIAIVDDNREYNEYIRKIVEDVIYEQGLKIEVLTFHGAETLLYEIEDGVSFDVYILDIEMPGMNGMELARCIRKKDERAYIIFVTSYSEFALEGYDVHACHYIMKEGLADKLTEVLYNVCAENTSEDAGAYYRITTNYRLEKFKFSDIIWIGKEGKNVIFMTRNGKYQQRATLQEVQALLPDEDFIFIERGKIVNLKYIEHVIKNEVILSNGDALMASRANVARVRKELTKYWGRKI